MVYFTKCPSFSTIHSCAPKLVREIIAVCSEIQIKHTNTMCGQNVEFVSAEPFDTHSNHET
jgi:hypothetical protein